MTNQTYTNSKGLVFEIDLLNADVPTDADYFGYNIRVTVISENMVNAYKAFVKKSLAQTEPAARMWLNTKGYDFLKQILETYNNGATQMLLPKSNGEWFIL